jgi:hypothetical protein
MASGKYTLLDLSARSGKNITSLIEGVLTVAPELRTFPMFPKSGITYSTLTRTELPSGDFRAVGGGTGLSKSAWQRDTGSMALFEAQMQVAEDIVIAARSENPDLVTEDILADEAIAYVKGSAIRIGSQMWYGTKISSAGFAGLSTQVDTANNEVNAGGSAGADSCSAYLVYIDDNPVNPQGVYTLLGNGGRMSMSDMWGKQQMPTPSDATKYFTAFTNNFLAYLGFAVARKEAVYRVKNITTANPFTDAVAAALWAKVPIALKADKSKFRWFMNSIPQFTLQASRATVTIAPQGKGNVGAGGVFPDLPETCMDIPIVLTDSLISTERAGLHQ